ncbi:hypothetical protein [Streptomyces sp. NPDC085937]|uniref:hypothetical protein n=1 Tax=Streptomyces sp. NPDC085937 TaxID=3365742 RepID=UPI0037D130B1
MSSPTDKLSIVVGEFPTDAALYNINGARTLFLSSGQTFSSAVRNVRNVMPGIALEAAERMIREQCPGEFKDFDDLLGLTRPAPPSVDRPPVAPLDDVVKEQPSNRRRRRAVLVAALLPALAASWALGRYTNVGSTAPEAPSQTAATAPDASPDSPADPQRAPFLEPRFTHFAGANNIDCDPISPLEAECTDADGKVMATKAATGPDSTIFTFSYGSERIGLRIFYDAAYAQTWARQDGTQDLYPNLQVHGRYALWGTDAARLAEYGTLIAQADRGVTPMGEVMATPLPPRLAALTLGTLGLDQNQVHQLIAQTPVPVPADTPTIMAARLVLGLDQAPLGPSVDAPGGEDIVAIAAGIEPASGPSGPTTEPTSPPQTTQPATQPSTTPVEPKPPATTPPAEPTKPPADTAPPQEPTKPPAATPPATTPPATTPPTSPPATTPPPVTPPPATTPPVTPPVGEEPSMPPVEPPAPTEPVSPVDPPPTDPVEPPADQAPDPTPEGPPGETPPADLPARPQEEGRNDLLILDSAWTVAAA